MLSVERYNGSTWVNISDYVISEGTGKIPFIERNSDWSPIASTFDLGISSAFGTAIVRGDRFRFYNDTQIIFAGYADKVIYDYERRYYRAQLINDLGKLDTLKVDSYNLHTLISTNGGDLYKFNPDDYVSGGEHYQSVGLLWAMKCCFVAAGMTLDTTSVDSVISGTWPGGGIIADYDVPFNKLALDYQSMYCLGQGVACNDTKINSDYYDSKITMLEFIEWLCKIFRFTIVLTDVNAYKLYQVNNTYTIADDNKYSYETDTRLKETAKAFVKQYASAITDANQIRHWYYQDSAHTLTEYIALDGWIIGDDPFPKEGELKLEYLNNLIIMPYTYNGTTWAPNMMSPAYDVLSPFTSWPTYSSYSLRQYLIEQKTKDIQKEKITTDYNTTVKSVLKNFIDINNRTSEIEQETYL